MNKCFGYHLIVDDANVIYTGDTSVYCGMIHLKLEDALENFFELNRRGIKVYLMHLDDVDAAKTN